MKKYIFISLVLLASIDGIAQQRHIVSGYITNASTNDPVSLATVSAIKSNTATTTNPLGYFRLTLSEFPDTLLITYLGNTLKKLVIQSAASDLNIQVIVSAKQLEEVTINTGYEKLTPTQVNGSYSVINTELLNRQTGTSILDRLKGTASGILFNTGKSNPNPQNKTNITIRGLSTINGPLDPLIVLDNFIYEGDLNNINPNDIESITILKDAAATSIWGARAGNGVIVITSKKGRFNENVKINFNSNLIFQDKPDLYYLPRISSIDYINLEQFLSNKGYYDNQIDNSSLPPLSPAVEIMLAKRNNLLSAADSASKINALKKIDSRNQFDKYFYRPGITQQYALSLQGGSSNLAWLLSGGYDKTVSNLRAKNERLNLRLDNTYRPFKKLEINTSLSYSSSLNVSGAPEFRSASSITGTLFVPYLQFADKGGVALPVTHNYRIGYIDTAGSGKLFDWHYYPLDDWRHSRNKMNVNEIIANIGIQYKVTKGIVLQLLYQYQQQNIQGTTLNDTSSFYTRDLINLFTQVNQDGSLKHIVPIGGILHKSHSDEFSQNFRSQVNFQHEWENARLNALAGLETREIGNSSNSNTYYGYYDDPLTVTNVDVINYYPTYITGYTSQLSGETGFTKTNYRFASFYGNGAFVYKKRYTVNASARKDGSNIFGATTNDKWKPLWSAGLGWILSNESFYNIHWLPYLKLSVTTGSSGNVDVTKSPLPVASAAADYVTGLPFIRINMLNNPNLRWERIIQSNLRLAFELPKGRVTGSIEYYRKNGKDLYGAAPYDYTAWGRNPTITKNVAAMKGYGVDVSLMSRNLIRSFKWNTQLFFSYNESITTKYYSVLENPVSQAIGGGDIINPIIGKPLYSIFAYKWGGLDGMGNPQGFIGKEKSTDYNAISKNIFDNGLDGGSLIYKGPATPRVYGNIINSFSWKNFEFDFNISYAFGYYLFKPALSYSALIKQGIGQGQYAHRWQKPGDEQFTNVPSFVYPVDSRRDQFYQFSEINVIKADNVRLMYINLSYNFPAWKNLPFKTLQIYGNVANLGLLWRANHENIDPDFISTIPNPRRFTIGLRTGF